MTPPDAQRGYALLREIVEDRQRIYFNPSVKLEIAALLDAYQRLKELLRHECDHHWRLPEGDEPYEVGGVCMKCGNYANNTLERA